MPAVDAMSASAAKSDILRRDLSRPKIAEAETLDHPTTDAVG